MRPTHVFVGCGCGVPPPGAGEPPGVGEPPPGVGEPPGAGCPLPPVNRSVIVRLAVSFRPPARSSASLTVARPPAARTAATPEAEKRKVTSLTERLRSLTLREAAFAEPAVTVAVPRSAWRVGLATSIVALEAESEDGLG